MTKKIFFTELLASCMVLVLVIGLIFGILTDVFEKELTDELSTEAHFIAATAEEYGEGCLYTFDKQDRRITLIGSDGNVIFDTKADPSSMENHADREEVMAAVENGEGSSVRESDTFMTKTI